jgi:hypothetical protein
MTTKSAKIARGAAGHVGYRRRSGPHGATATAAAGERMAGTPVRASSRGGAGRTAPALGGFRRRRETDSRYGAGKQALFRPQRQAPPRGGNRPVSSRRSVASLPTVAIRPHSLKAGGCCRADYLPIGEALAEAQRLGVAIGTVATAACGGSSAVVVWRWRRMSSRMHGRL